jgi:hypothetical protein
MIESPTGCLSLCTCDGELLKTKSPLPSPDGRCHKTLEQNAGHLWIFSDRVDTSDLGLLLQTRHARSLLWNICSVCYIISSRARLVVLDPRRKDNEYCLNGVKCANDIG